MNALESGLVLLLFVLALVRPFAALCGLLSLLILGERAAAGLHLQVGPVPFYVTETVLAGFFVRLLIRTRLKQIRPKAWLEKEPHQHYWIGLYGNAAVSTLRGAFVYHALDVIRDLALIYYSAFRHFTAIMLRDRKTLERLAWVIGSVVLVKIALCISGVGQLLGVDFNLVGSANSLYIACLLGFLVFTQMRKPSLRAVWMGGMTLLLAILIQQRVRSAWTGLAGAGLFYLICVVRFQWGVRSLIRPTMTVLMGVVLAYALPDRTLIELINAQWTRMTRVTPPDPALAAAVAPAIPASVPAMQNTSTLATTSSVPKRPTSPSRSIPEVWTGEISHNDITEEFTSLFHGLASPNVETRLWLWTDALESLTGVSLPFFTEKRRDPYHMIPKDRVPLERRIGPIILRQEIRTSAQRILAYFPPFRLLNGVPFGEKFVPRRIYWWLSTAQRYDPHNSHIAVLMRTGLIGFLLYGLLLAGALRRGWRFAVHITDPTIQQATLGLMAAILAHMVHSLTDVTLENSYRGLIFWVLLGALEAIQHLPDSDTHS